MQKARGFLAIFVLGTFLLSVSGCGVPSVKSSTGEGGKLKVITTLFPQFDFVREIGKDKVDVSLLLPPGVEAHSFEPSPQDIVSIQKSGVFVYTGEFMEPWAHKVIETTKNKKLMVVDSSKGIDLMDEEEHEHEHTEGNNKAVETEHEEEHDHGGKDPHIWLDPVFAQKMVDNIVEGLSKADSKNENFYKENGESYKKQLQDLDKSFSEAFKKTKYKTIMYGGHFAFGYFAKRYGLTNISPYNGFSPNAEPNPQRIAELIKNMKESGSKVIYYEELIEPKVAKVISDQTGATMLLLHGAHNVSKDEINSGITYIKIMQDNLTKLKQGLGYNE